MGRDGHYAIAAGRPTPLAHHDRRVFARRDQSLPLQLDAPAVTYRCALAPSHTAEHHPPLNRRCPHPIRSQLESLRQHTTHRKRGRSCVGWWWQRQPTWRAPPLRRRTRWEIQIHPPTQRRISCVCHGQPWTDVGGARRTRRHLDHHDGAVAPLRAPTGTRPRCSSGAGQDSVRTGPLRGKRRTPRGARPWWPPGQ